MLDIHVGIRRDELKPFRRILHRQFNAFRVQLRTGEDRWEDWGRAWPEAVKSDDDIIHVVIRTDIPMALIQFLVGSLMVFLNEITNEQNSLVGRYILVTDEDEWTAIYPEFTYPEF